MRSNVLMSGFMLKPDANKSVLKDLVEQCHVLTLTVLLVALVSLAFGRPVQLAAGCKVQFGFWGRSYYTSRRTCRAHFPTWRG